MINITNAQEVINKKKALIAEKKSAIVKAETIIDASKKRQQEITTKLAELGVTPDKLSEAITEEEKVLVSISAEIEANVNQLNSLLN